MFIKFTASFFDSKPGMEGPAHHRFLWKCFQYSYCVIVSDNFLVPIWQEHGDTYYKYGGWWSVWSMGTYSMVLSKAAFFHRKYLDLYTHKMPSPIHDYVSRERLAVIILLSFRDFYFCDKINTLLFNYFFNVPNWISISYRNCEDIAMSLLVANATGAPPIWVKGSCLYLSWCKFVTLSRRCTG